MLKWPLYILLLKTFVLYRLETVNRAMIFRRMELDTKLQSLKVIT